MMTMTTKTTARLTDAQRRELDRLASEWGMAEFEAAGFYAEEFAGEEVTPMQVVAAVKHVLVDGYANDAVQVAIVEFILDTDL